MSKSKSKAEEAAGKCIVVWVGPRLPYVRPGQAMDASRLPRFMRRYIDACPSAEKLLVAAGKLPTARLEVKRVGSQLSQASRIVARHFGVDGIRVI